MDNNGLIGDLREKSLYRDKATLEIMDLCMEAAGAIEHLEAENAALREQLTELQGKYDSLNDFDNCQSAGLLVKLVKKEKIADAYAQSARAIALYLDRSLPYAEMIADAAQKAAAENRDSPVAENFCLGARQIERTYHLAAVGHAACPRRQKI